MRQEFPKRVRVAAFERCGGQCENCRGRILRRLQYDHIVPDAVGGLPTLANCAVLCEPCHTKKTATVDAPAIAKTTRILAKRAGADRPTSRPLPGTKASGWKKPFGRPAERRS